MAVEMLLMYVEVIYLWRALPFCSSKVKQQLLDKLSAPLPAEAQPVHHALKAWLQGGILNSLSRPIEAEKVRMAQPTVTIISEGYSRPKFSLVRRY